jgi:hypothetical protein
MGKIWHAKKFNENWVVVNRSRDYLTHWFQCHRFLYLQTISIHLHITCYVLHISFWPGLRPLLIVLKISQRVAASYVCNWDFQLNQWLPSWGRIKSTLIRHRSNKSLVPGAAEPLHLEPQFEMFFLQRDQLATQLHAQPGETHVMLPQLTGLDVVTPDEHQ